jgi:diphthamide biosynthesis protein 4
MFRTGLEVLDLEDMETETHSALGNEGGSKIWYHSCRCGEEKGFLIREEDLARDVERGEVVIGCVGCSLWARVTFAVDDDSEEADDERK